MEERRSTTNADRPDKPEDAAAVHPTDDEEQDRKKRDDSVDESSADSFPSSDPPSW
jgi:hypothetical protein